MNYVKKSSIGFFQQIMCDHSPICENKLGEIH